jgi:biotin transporter BioY
MLMQTSLWAAFKVSVAPHLAGDVVKVLLAAALLPAGWKLLKRRASGQA